MKTKTKTKTKTKKLPHYTRRKRKKRRIKKTRSRITRGRTWLKDPLLVRFYRKVIIPFFENKIPATVSEYEEQLAIFFGTDYREVYPAKILAPFKLPGNIWIGESPYSVSPTWGRRNMWPDQNVWIRFDRRDVRQKVTIEFQVTKEVMQTYSLTGDEWASIMDKVQVRVPLYLSGRSEQNVQLIREQHAQSIRDGLGVNTKVKFINKR